jgi:hypothetical protein
MAEALEVAAKTGDFAKVMSGNDAFIRAVEALLPQFKALLDDADALLAGDGGDRAAAPDPEQLAKMLEASRDYDIEAMQSVMEELDRRVYDSGGELVARLKEQLANFDYDGIQQELEAALARRE